jgi:hypothetical protein
VSRSDDKFAWPKSHALNAALEERLRGGLPIRYDDLVAATQTDETGDAAMVTFSTASAGGEKGNYVIFQYGLVLEDPDGRIAVFQRIDDDKGFGTRNLRGPTILVSGSRMMKPAEALESIVNDKLSFGKGAPPGDLEPIGFAWNRQVRRKGVERADYLFCLFRLRVRDNRLNGLLRDNPDSFDWWRRPADLSPDGLDGPVDRAVLRCLYGPQVVEELHGPVWFQPRSRLADSRGKVLSVAPFEVQACRTVFLSHDAAAQLKAFLLRDVLLKRSSQRLFPFLDTHDVLNDSGSFWTRIESLIERSDVFLVLVTEGTARSPGVRHEIDYWKTLDPRPAPVVVLVDGGPEDVPEDLRDQNLHDYTGRQYRAWHKVLEGLVEVLEKKPYRENSSRAKDPS